MNAPRFDFHCHVDLHKSPAGFLSYLSTERVKTLAVTTLPGAVPQNLDWSRSLDNVQVGCGLHPELVESHADTAKHLFKLIPTSSYVGEIGMDGSQNHRATLDLQESIFRKAVSLCGQDRPTLISIHSRGAAEQVVHILEKKHATQQFTPILHWYSGSLSTMRRAAEIGCYFSVNAKMLASEQGRRLVSKMPADRLLPETDAPFTTDGSVKGHATALEDLELALGRTTNRDRISARELLAHNGQRVMNTIGA